MVGRYRDRRSGPNSCPRGRRPQILSNGNDLVRGMNMDAVKLGCMIHSSGVCRERYDYPRLLVTLDGLTTSKYVRHAKFANASERSHPATLKREVTQTLSISGVSYAGTEHQHQICTLSLVTIRKLDLPKYGRRTLHLAQGRLPKEAVRSVSLTPGSQHLLSLTMLSLQASSAQLVAWANASSSSSPCTRTSHSQSLVPPRAAQGRSIKMPCGGSRLCP